MHKPNVFYKPGVNPSNMSPDVSGDTIINVQTRAGRLHGVLDGAWMPGFEHFEKENNTTTDGWSSQATARSLKKVMKTAAPDISLPEIMAATVELYHDEVEILKAQTGYKPRDSLIITDPQKFMPQCAGVIALFRENGQIDICQWADCFVALAYRDETVKIITPDQFASVSQASKDGTNRIENPLTYQAFVKTSLESGMSYGAIRHQVQDMAVQVHAPDFFQNLWLKTDEKLNTNLSGEEGFAIWRQNIASICKEYNCAQFMNNPNNPLMIADNGEIMPTSYAMMTGEKAMLPLINYKTITPEQSYHLKALYLSSDGALGPDASFFGGQRESALRKLHRLGSADYYDYMRDSMFEYNQQNVTQQKSGGKGTGYHPTHIPMDVSIVQIPIPRSKPKHVINAATRHIG